MSDFHDWKRHPVTEAVFSELKGREAFLVERLVANAATLPQVELAELAGAIKAIRDLLNISADELQETDE